jgi:hypothetical protein
MGPVLKEITVSWKTDAWSLYHSGWTVVELAQAWREDLVKTHAYT